MTRWAWVACAVVLPWIGTAGEAFADTVTLANGDVLHGEVREVDGRIRIQHALLGTIDVARTDVTRITREGETPPAPVPAAVVAATAKRVTGPCAPCAKAAPCAEAAEETAEECPSPWDFSVGFGISNEAGNTEKFQLNADLMAAYRWGRNRLRWRVNSFYEEAAGVQTEGRYSSNLKYTREITARSRLFGLWILDRDDFADIELRNGWFAGYGYDFIKRKRTTFSGAIGAGFVTEKRTDEPLLTTAALFAELEYKHEFSTGDSFEAKYYVIPYLDQTELSPMRLELLYAHPLRDHFDLTAGFLGDYVPDPPGTIKPYDTKITFGVRWKP